MIMSMASSSPATVAVDKATSDLLIGPDWTMNIDICDSINSNHWQAKDVVKAVKRRLQHKSPKVHLLALTLLETMVKNCGDYVHFQIAERSILEEMVKMARKKADMHVRDKILVLLDSWQEAFGGPSGRYPQYYWAYEDLRRSGLHFPRRSLDAAPIFTPPATHPNLRQNDAGFGLPSNSSRTLDETMAAESENMSMADLESMRNITDLLTDMLEAVKPGDQQAIKDDVIIDLVNRCRSNQKKLMQMLATTGDEELLARGLELNDGLQSLLAKHDAIASNDPILISANATETSISNKSSNASCSSDSALETGSIRTPEVNNSATQNVSVTNSLFDGEEEEEDDFAQLARRHSKAPPAVSPTPSAGSSGSTAETYALALSNPPAPVKTSNEQDMVEFLSLVLATTSTSPRSPQTPPTAFHHANQVPVSTSAQVNPYSPENNAGHQAPPVNQSSYVVPWAQPQVQPQAQVQPQYQSQHQFGSQFQNQSHFQAQSENKLWPELQPQPRPNSQPQPWSVSHSQPQPTFQAKSQIPSYPEHQAQSQLQASQPQYTTQSQPQYPMQAQPQYLAQSQGQYQPQSQLRPAQQLQTPFLQYPSAYPPPPWAATPGYYNSQIHAPAANGRVSTPSASVATSQTLSSLSSATPAPHINSFPSRGSNAPTTSTGGQKPTFIPSYRLFEDLNVLGTADGKPNTSASYSISGSLSQGMVGGRK